MRSVLVEAQKNTKNAAGKPLLKKVRYIYLNFYNKLK
jgi:hypothetical protein